MKNNQMLPFERNRYYPGKLLTSADFGAEQAYQNNKRRFVNSMVLGSGVVCGLDVTDIGENSLMIDSGVAVDIYGREIVFEKTEIVNFSALTGFEALESNSVALCLRYDEKDVKPVYSIGAGGEEYEFNRIQEGCELFLADADSLPEQSEPQDEFLSSATLYEDADYSVIVSLPAVIPVGTSVKLNVKALDIAVFFPISNTRSPADDT